MTKTERNNNNISTQLQSLHKSDFQKIHNCGLCSSLHKQSPIEEDNGKRWEDQLTEDFLKLSAELEADGLMEHNSFTHIIGVGNTMALFSVGLYVSFYSENSVIWAATGVILITLAGGPSLLCGQEGLIMGLSTSSLTAQHTEFHVMLNYENDNTKMKSEPNGFWFHFDRFWFLFWDALIVTLSWKLNYHLEFVIQNEYWFELICMLAHYSLIPLLGFWVWFGVTWLSSILIVINLILSHIQKPIVNREIKLQWIENIFARVTNIRSFCFINWWTVHLNYQIEHHLFPQMPYHNLALCTNKVRAFAKKHNLPYQQCSLLEACKLAYFNPIKEIILL